MDWYGLPTAIVGLGAAGLAGGLLLLHLLQVRLRRIPVDTLLFFRAAGAEQRPRTLFGPPRRWLAYLVALLVGLLLWLAFADPRADSARPSRVVVAVLDGSSDASAGELVQAALQFASEAGLGPRGGVLAAAATPRWLRADDEPDLVARARAAELVRSGGGAGLPAALQVAADRLGPAPGGEIVVFGGSGTLPAELCGQRIVRGELPGSPAAGFAQIHLDESEPRALRIEPVGFVAGDVIHIRAGAAGPAALPAGAVTIFPALPESAHDLRIELRRGEQVLAAVTVAVPARAQSGVALAGDLPEAVALAVLADPLLEAEPSAPLRVSRDPATPGPALILESGIGAGPRAADVTDRCPLPLAFGALRRADAAVLPRREGQQVWVRDLESGAPLVTLEQDAAGAPRIHVASWLLDEAHRRDVPRLLAGGLRLLAGIASPSLLAAQVPSEWPIAAPARQLEPAPGRSLLAAPALVPVVAGALGTVAVEDAFGRVHRAAVWPAAAPHHAGEPDAAPEPRSSGPRWLVWLLLLALLGLGADVWLHHRGRIP